jgi:hypothetical protein
MLPSRPRPIASRDRRPVVSGRLRRRACAGPGSRYRTSSTFAPRRRGRDTRDARRMRPCCAPGCRRRRGPCSARCPARRGSSRTNRDAAREHSPRARSRTRCGANDRPGFRDPFRLPNRASRGEARSPTSVPENIGDSRVGGDSPRRRDARRDWSTPAATDRRHADAADIPRASSDRRDRRAAKPSWSESRRPGRRRSPSRRRPFARRISRPRVDPNSRPRSPRSPALRPRPAAKR